MNGTHKRPAPEAIDFLCAQLELAAQEFEHIGQRINAARLRRIVANQRPLGTIPDYLRAPTFAGYMNIYRSGWFHRIGKPDAYDRHPGDLYPTADAALRDMEPRSHYICTVPVEWPESQTVPHINPPDSQPVPLSVTRRHAREEVSP